MPEPASGGVSAPGGGFCSGGCLLRGGCLLPGGCLLRGGCGIPTCTEADTPPPVDRITDTYKNITLATTSLRPVKMCPCLHTQEILILFEMGGGIVECETGRYLDTADVS